MTIPATGDLYLESQASFFSIGQELVQIGEKEIKKLEGELYTADELGDLIEKTLLFFNEEIHRCYSQHNRMLEDIKQLKDLQLNRMKGYSVILLRSFPDEIIAETNLIQQVLTKETNPEKVRTNNEKQVRDILDFCIGYLSEFYGRLLEVQNAVTDEKKEIERTATQEQLKWEFAKWHKFIKEFNVKTSFIRMISEVFEALVCCNQLQKEKIQKTIQLSIEYDTKISTLSERNETLQKESKKNKLSVDSYKFLAEGRKDKIEKQKLALKLLEQQKKDLQTKHDKIAKQLRGKKIQLPETKDKIDPAVKKEFAKKEHLLIEEVAKYQSSVKTAEKKIEELQDALELERSKNAKMQKKMSQTAAKIDRLTHENFQLKKEKDHLLQQSNKAKKEALKQIEMMKKEIVSLKLQNKKKQEVVERFDHQVKEVKTKNTQLQDRIEKLNAMEVGLNFQIRSLSEEKAYLMQSEAALAYQVQHLSSYGYPMPIEFIRLMQENENGIFSLHQRVSQIEKQLASRLKQKARRKKS